MSQIYIKNKIKNMPIPKSRHIMLGYINIPYMQQ